MKIEREVFTSAARVIKELTSANFVFGNGGSSAIANHMECDVTKSTDGKYRVISLCANTSMLTAIANDLGYKETCAAQLRWRNFGYNPPNAVILISSSGNSKNIIRAAEFCKEQKAKLIAFTGFDGGKLKKLADVSVHIDSNDYGEIEDFHSNVMHEIVRQLKEQK